MSRGRWDRQTVYAKTLKRANLVIGPLRGVARRSPDDWIALECWRTLDDVITGSALLHKTKQDAREGNDSALDRLADQAANDLNEAVLKAARLVMDDQGIDVPVWAPPPARRKAWAKANH